MRRLTAVLGSTVACLLRPVDSSWEERGSSAHVTCCISQASMIMRWRPTPLLPHCKLQLRCDGPCPGLTSGSLP